MRDFFSDFIMSDDFMVSVDFMVSDDFAGSVVLVAGAPASGCLAAPGIWGEVVLPAPLPDCASAVVATRVAATVRVSALVHLLMCVFSFCASDLDRDRWAGISGVGGATPMPAG